ncbi:MAG: putative toxin-antitoxin system toxin component, PIN family [Deltaproteobacteria bacterium]|nr:putative toxin-antitoxin system toxin component, PIN family [Deltaproteobacteria bacterium]
MVRACIDTNIWVSALISSGAPSKVVELAFRRKFNLVLSPAMLDELHRTMVSKFEFTRSFAGKVRFRISQVADLYNPTGSIRIVPGKHFDNLVLETAVLGKAKYLVTGDRKHLLPIKVFHNVKIVDPVAFLEVLNV